MAIKITIQGESQEEKLQSAKEQGYVVKSVLVGSRIDFVETEWPLTLGSLVARRNEMESVAAQIFPNKKTYQFFIKPAVKHLTLTLGIADNMQDAVQIARAI